MCSPFLAPSPPPPLKAWPSVFYLVHSTVYFPRLLISDVPPLISSSLKRLLLYFPASSIRARRPLRRDDPALYPISLFGFHLSFSPPQLLLATFLVQCCGTSPFYDVSIWRNHVSLLVRSRDILRVYPSLWACPLVTSRLTFLARKLFLPLHIKPLENRLFSLLSPWASFFTTASSLLYLIFHAFDFDFPSNSFPLLPASFFFPLWCSFR